MPKFQGEAFYQNLKLVEALQAFAQKKGCTPAQLAISWVRNLSGKPGIPDVIPIPGAVSAARIEENGKEFSFTAEEEKEIDEILKSITVVGARYPGDTKGFVEV
jgi:pyridoxine 4-dehydrogenase